MAAPEPPKGVKPGDLLVVAHNLVGRGPDELTLKCGDNIELVELDEEFGDGWYLGKQLRTGKTGLFPANYTKALSADAVITPYRTESPVQADNLASQPQPAFVPPDSGETTPQASRHASSSEMQAPKVDAETPQASPKQQQRSTSSPLPRPSLAGDIQTTSRTSSIDCHMNGEDSPVMNETLSVIDEHITDMSTPRHSMSATQEAKPVNDSGSEYSSHFSHRISYINGQETDEEEGIQPAEEQVRKWNQHETAKHLGALGVDPKHCDIFEEQEITGDVLLDMDQDFIFMKEFDFGVMGKRLKTWHKIKAFQEEVKRSKQRQQLAARGSTSSVSPPSEERTLARAGHTGPLLPRIPTLPDKSGTYPPSRGSLPPGQHPRLASNTSSPLTPHSPSFIHDSPRRMSAASIRELNHSRRHSSMDSTNRGLPDSSLNGFHQKKPSLDMAWTLNSTGSHALPARPGTSMGTTAEGKGFRGPLTTESDSPVSARDQYDDLDRGYFSGTEADSRLRNRRVLHKRPSPEGSVSHSRKSSYAEDLFRVQKASAQPHSRISSIDSIQDVAKSVPTSQGYHGIPQKSRSTSNRVSEKSGLSSTGEGKSGFFASFAPRAGKGDSESSARSSPLHFQHLKNAGPKFRRAVGLRAISAAVGKNGHNTSAPGSPRDTDIILDRTGSTTPSATSKSSERHSTDGSGKAVDGAGFLIRPRTVKSKKDTSAYTRGLEKKTPQEQMGGCDYSGWMKKRSSNLMTTWKPRLFVLRGRRLSYYYSENDTEERGLIDITAHRVLRADNDPITALHATLTGANALPTDPTNSSTGEQPGGAKVVLPSMINSALHKDGNGPFFFKLVPPKSGNSRTVQFTKPAIHYFQVDNVKEGRRWMAALMKSTIERDPDQVVESTNKQKTISLKQARKMSQRPPALMDIPTPPDERPSMDEGEEEKWLMVEGLNVDKPLPPPREEKGTDGNVEGSDPEGIDRPESNALGELDTGPLSLLPDPLAKTESQ